MELDGKAALVTGASRGIGRQVALDFAKAGARVALTARNSADLDTVAAEIQQLGGTAIAIPADMAVESEIDETINRVVERFGGLDILINNAGLGHFRPVAELATADWDEMFNLNVRGLFIATRQALPHLRRAGESAIVNVASLAGKNAFVNGGGCAATKHAVLGFSRCLMLEERKNGVRVLAICPGSVNTDFSVARRADDDTRRARILQPADVSDSILAMLKLPQRAMLSEIDLRPSVP